MEDLNTFFQSLYKNFNERNIELVIAKMTEDVQWANGMDGGFVYGHEGVREYWTRQFKMINSKVTPLAIEEENGIARIKVTQVVHDLNGSLLMDDIVFHFFRIRDGLIASFDIGDKPV